SGWKFFVDILINPVIVDEAMDFLFSRRNMEVELPASPISDRLHELIRHKYRDVKVGQSPFCLFGFDELQDIGMGTVHHTHHSTSSMRCGHDRTTHSIPRIHKG